MIILPRYCYRICFCVIVILCYLFALSCDHVPNAGIGWDGAGYYNLIKNFDSVYWNGNLNQYHMQRILPFAAVFYAKEYFGIEATPQFAINTMNIFNLFCILLTCFFFYKIVDLLCWKKKTEIIAFSSLFFTYPILKYAPWYPILTDSFALLLSFAGVYFYLKKKYVWGIFILILSMLAWPMVSVIEAILLMFPSTPVVWNKQQNKVSVYSFYIIRWSISLFVPISIATFCVYYNYIFDGDMPNFNLFGMLQYDPKGVLFPIFCGSITGWFLFKALSVLLVDYSMIYKELTSQRSLAKIFLIGSIFSICYFVSRWGGAPSQMTLSVQLSNLYKMPSSFPLIFLEAHFSIFPVLLVLYLCYWNRIVAEVIRFGVCFYAAFLVSVLFSLDLETRKLISFYPIIMIPLWSAIDKLEFRRYIVVAVAGFSLFASAFWYSPEIPIAKIIYSYRGYAQFAGPWQGWREYVIGSFLLLFSLAILYFLNRRNLIYANTNKSL